MRAGFTMIELIFSLVIIAIVASIGTDIIKSVYERYTASRDIEIAQNDMRRALDQIANRLQYRIKNSTIARKGKDADTIISINDASINPEYDILEWIGIDYLSLRDGNYTGYIVLDDKGDLNMSYFDENLTKEIRDHNKTIVFLEENYRGYADHLEYGWSSQGNQLAYNDINESNNTVNLITRTATGSQTPLFYVANSAYALFVDESETLKLAYDYYPWNDKGLPNSFYDDNVSVSRLLENVATFQFQVDKRGVLLIVLCVKTPESAAGENKRDGTEKNEYAAKFCRQKAIL